MALISSYGASSSGFIPGEYFSGHLSNLWRVPKIDIYFSGHLSLPTYQILSDFRGAPEEPSST